MGDVYMSIANAKLAPDADLKFLNQLEMVVIGQIKHTGGQAPGGAQPPGSQGPPGGGPGGPPGGPGAPGQPGPPPRGNATPGGGPTANTAVPPPDMDEVRKTIAQTTGP